MQNMTTLLGYITPWQFSIAWTLACVGPAWLYLLGVRRLRASGQRVSPWLQLACLLGIAAVYVVTQTHYDYLALYMFFSHRLQHLVLHHVAPFLIALSAPWSVMAAGMPAWCRDTLLARLAGNRVARAAYAFVQHPLVAPLLFVGLIYFWLVPAIHFEAMLSRRLYDLMNWSMLIDGLLFWWLILDPRPGRPNGPSLRYGTRVLLLIVIMPPQIALGAYIALSHAELFDIYDICGRAWPLSPMTDQQIGGLLTWIPGAMMSVVAGLVLLRRLLSGQAGGAPRAAAQRV